MNDRFIRINGKDFSLDDVAKALGIQPENDKPLEVDLCQRIDAGVLVARGSNIGGDEYPGIDVELELPKEKDSLPVMLSRTEQPRPDGDVQNVRTFCFSRLDEYFMYFDADLRSDKEVDELAIPPHLCVAGNPGFNPVITADNRYVDFEGSTERYEKMSLLAQINSAEKRSAAPKAQDPVVPER